MTVVYKLVPRERVVFHVLARRSERDSIRLVCNAYDETHAIYEAEKFFGLNPDHYVEVSRTMERVEL